MKLETPLNLTHTEELILQSAFETQQDALMRIYSGESGIFAEEMSPELRAILQNYEYQVQLSEDYLRYQKFLENPHSFSKADSTDLAVIRIHLLNYYDEVGKKHGEDNLNKLIEKLIKCSDAHLSLGGGGFNLS